MTSAISGAGLGFRRGLVRQLEDCPQDLAAGVDFMEVAPENWIDVGGRFGRSFREFTERFAFVCHGLSLSIGGPEPLDMALLEAIKQFLDEHRIAVYTEHLSACSDGGHLYDLMPIPFTEDAVDYVAGRVRQVQEVLERRIGVENISYYAVPTVAPDGEPLPGALTELEFVNAVVAEADCLLLLDVNNIYVNSINHGYDPSAFLRGLPGDRAAYFHVAGHHVEAEDLRVDTHASAVVDPVWALLEEAYRLYGPVPTLLERDFNLPPLADLLAEVARVRSLQASAPAASARRTA